MWAFSDESERGDRMFLGVVFVPSVALGRSRAALRKLLLPGQRYVHTRHESPRRRRILLDTVARMGVTAVVFRTRRSAGDRIGARRLLLTAACAEVRERGAAGWVLDDVEPVQRTRDHHTIRAVLGDVVHDHRPGHTELLLWVADLVCWAVGAGPEWRRRVRETVELRKVP